MIMFIYNVPRVLLFIYNVPSIITDRQDFLEYDDKAKKNSNNKSTGSKTHKFAV